MTEENAQEIAEFILSHEHQQIHTIGIFGSVAREGIGNDLDLIIFTFRSTMLRFMEKSSNQVQQLKKEGNEVDKNTLSRIRKEIAKVVLSLDFLCANQEMEDQLDVYLFPASLEEDVDRWIREGNGAATAFMQSVVKDLKYFDPVTKTFIKKPAASIL